MPFFTTKGLRERSQQTYRRIGKSASVELREAASRLGSYNFFLSHSFHDARVIRGLRREIRDMGFSVYVDWVEDAQLDRSRVTLQTARVLRERMRRCQAMLYASSPNASGSLWMPWEAGYFDAAKRGRVAVIPLFEEDPGTERYKGREYLGLYPYVVKDTAEDGEDTLWVQTDEHTYVSARAWLNGTAPYRRT